MGYLFCRYNRINKQFINYVCYLLNNIYIFNQPREELILKSNILFLKISSSDISFVSYSVNRILLKSIIYKIDSIVVKPHLFSIAKELTVKDQTFYMDRCKASQFSMILKDFIRWNS